MRALTRTQVLSQLADHLVALAVDHPLRVAIDGIDGSGKTTLADALAPSIEQRGRPVIRASVDHFHRPRAERYQRGDESPEGYYLDSFDYPALLSSLLLPLGPSGSRRYRIGVYDVVADVPLVAELRDAPVDAVLLVDGVFLQRPEIQAVWDYVIFLTVPFHIALQRNVRRDLSPGQSEREVTTRYLRRYLPGQRLYLDAVEPRERAQAVVDNMDPQRPGLLRLR